MMDINGKPIVVIDKKPEWYHFAKSLMGIKEIVGSENNATIVDMFSYTTLGKQPDEVPWCSAFVNYCLFKTGFWGTKSAAARSFTWGNPKIKKLESFKEGCIVVIPRGDNPAQGHVGFCVSYKKYGPVHKLQILGGNQGNEVNVSTYWKKPLGFYWPEKIG